MTPQANAQETMKAKLAALAIGVVMTLVIFELFSVGWYALTQGGLFYTAEKTPPVSVAREVAPGESAKHRLHPYFGFVKISDAERDINNHGFPAAPDENAVASKAKLLGQANRLAPTRPEHLGAL